MENGCFTLGKLLLFQVVVGRAAHMVHLLSKQQRSALVMTRNGELVDALLHVSRTTRNGDITRDTAGALYHMSAHGDGLMHIFRSGGIAELVRMLASPISAVVHYAITTLHNLIMHQDNAKVEVRACGGIEAMVPLLDRNNDKLLSVVTDCTYLLMFEHPESKLVFLSAGGTPKLVQIINLYNYDKLVYTTMRNLKTLSADMRNKDAIVAAGKLPGYIMDYPALLIGQCTSTNAVWVIFWGHFTHQTCFVFKNSFFASFT